MDFDKAGEEVLKIGFKIQAVEIDGMSCDVSTYVPDRSRIRVRIAKGKIIEII